MFFGTENRWRGGRGDRGGIRLNFELNQKFTIKWNSTSKISKNLILISYFHRYSHLPLLRGGVIQRRGQIKTVRQKYLHIRILRPKYWKIDTHVVLLSILSTTPSTTPTTMRGQETDKYHNMIKSVTQIGILRWKFLKKLTPISYFYQFYRSPPQHPRPIDASEGG